MVRCEYVQRERAFMKWFYTLEDAHETMKLYRVAPYDYRLKLVEFPFECIRPSVNDIMAHPTDESGDKLHWLNQWAVGPASGIPIKR